MDLRLSTPAGELTRAEQKILDYINTNTDAFLFSSIGQLAQQLELSDATVLPVCPARGCRDFKALKSLVLEQSPGPAVKLAATLSQGARFSPQAWLERQRAYLETTIQQLSTGEFDRAVEALCSASGYSSTGKTPPPPWPSCSTSACGGWAYRYLSCPPAALNCWKGSRKRRRTIWWCCSAFPNCPGRDASSWSTVGPPVTGRWPLWDAPACPRRSGRTSVCSPTAAPKRSTTPWLPPRPAGRPGRRCGGAVRSRKRGTPSVAAPDEKRLLSGWMNASPMRVYTWGMRSFSRITHGFYTHFTAPR